MPPLSEIKMGGHLKCLLKGPPDTAKSCAALSFPKPMYIFDMDGRKGSLIKWINQSGFKDLSTDVDIDSYNARDYISFDKKVETFKTNGPGKYKTVVLDSLTSMGDLLIEYGNMQRGKDKGKWMGVVAIPGFEEYGAESSGLSKTMEIMRNLPCNFVLVAHEIEKRTKIPNQPDKVEYRLLTAGAPIAARLPVYFNHILHFKCETPINVGGSNKYLVYTNQSGDHFARTELPLPDKMDITGRKFYDVLVSELKIKGIEL
jgi:AAA domain-containing protein